MHRYEAGLKSELLFLSTVWLGTHTGIKQGFLSNILSRVGNPPQETQRKTTAKNVNYTHITVPE
jgi:hypothetical protein